MKSVISTYIHNLPPYELDKYIVARIDEDSRELWFYGTYKDAEEARSIAIMINNGVVLEKN